MAQAMEKAFDGFWMGYVSKEAVRRSSEALKVELGFEELSAAERMMIEHVVMCHARLGMIEHLYSRQTSLKSYRMDFTEHFEKRLTLAQKRFTRHDHFSQSPGITSESRRIKRCGRESTPESKLFRASAEDRIT